MRTALIVIAMGEIYWKYAENLIASAKRFFIPHDVFLFTDRVTLFNVEKQIDVPPLGFTMATLMRYHWVCMEREALLKYDNIFYSDADMLFVSPVIEEDVLSNGIAATEHPGYIERSDLPEYESNTLSTAYLKRARVYLCGGGLNGGTSEAYLKMADVIRANVNTDLSNRIIAKWYDESHLNRYCYDNPPARILSPAFCYPDAEGYRTAWAKVRGVGYPKTVIPKLRALEKTSEELAQRGGPR